MLLFCMFLFRFTKLFSNLMFSIPDEIIGHTNDCAHTHTLTSDHCRKTTCEMEKRRKTVVRVFFSLLSTGSGTFGSVDDLYALCKCSSARRSVENLIM